jgi:hypothetical protein
MNSWYFHRGGTEDAESFSFALSRSVSPDWDRAKQLCPSGIISLDVLLRIVKNLIRSNLSFLPEAVEWISSVPKAFGADEKIFSLCPLRLCGDIMLPCHI